MDIFVFASKNLTNIWAGIGARLWAVSHRGDAVMELGRKTKSQNMRIGSFGILYCNETHALTTPFIVYSKPDLHLTVENVWPEKWVLPFRIFPLGSPKWQLDKDEARRFCLSSREPAQPISERSFTFRQSLHFRQQKSNKKIGNCSLAALPCNRQIPSMPDHSRAFSTTPSPLEGEAGNAPALPGGGWCRERRGVIIPSWPRRLQDGCVRLRPTLKYAYGPGCGENNSKGHGFAASNRLALMSRTFSVPRPTSSSKSTEGSTPKTKSAMRSARAGSKGAVIESCASGTMTCSPIRTGWFLPSATRWTSTPPPGNADALPTSPSRGEGSFAGTASHA